MADKQEKPIVTRSGIGRDFEDAVALIEESILKESPGYRKDLFVLEPRKRVHVSGVLHEIDLYVTVDHGEGYRSVFVFECKARRQPVSKNDVIAFSAKVRAASAQAGFFIAPAFSKYAVSQAALDPRVKLHHASVSTSAAPAFPLSVETVRDVVPDRIGLEAEFRSPPPDLVSRGDTKRVVLRRDGFEITLAEFLVRCAPTC